MGRKTRVAKYGPTGPPSRMDCSSLVSITSLTKVPTDRHVRCVGSCTAHLEELTDPTDMVQGVGAEVTLQK